MHYSGCWCSRSEATFLITGTRLYVSVITLSTQDNAELFER